MNESSFVAEARPKELFLANMGSVKRTNFLNDVKKRKSELGNPFDQATVIGLIKDHFPESGEIRIENPKGIGEIYKVPLPEGELLLSHKHLSSF